MNAYAIPPYTKGQAQNPSKNGSDGASQSVTKVPRQEPRFKGAARKASALRKLGITEDQLASVPNITSLLKEAKVGLKAVIAALRFSQDPVAKAFLKKYDACTSSVLHFAPLEAIALAAA